jgi:hypothetical protein
MLGRQRVEPTQSIFASDPDNCSMREICPCSTFGKGALFFRNLAKVPNGALIKTRFDEDCCHFLAWQLEQVP